VCVCVCVCVHVCIHTRRLINTCIYTYIYIYIYIYIKSHNRKSICTGYDVNWREMAQRGRDFLHEPQTIIELDKFLPV